MSGASRRVLFVYAPQEGSRSYMDGHIYSRAGLQLACQLGKEAKDRSMAVEVNILDGNLMDEGRIYDEVSRGDFDVLGISLPSSFAYNPAVRIARKARQHSKGKIILGGKHLEVGHEGTSMGRMVLDAAPEVDAVCYGPGEHAFASYVLEGEEGAPNLMWRRTGTVQVNPPRSGMNIDVFTPIDPALLDLRAYTENFRQARREVYGIEGSGEFVVTTMTHSGCGWRDVSGGGCKFCISWADPLFVRPPQKFWEEVGLYAAEYGRIFGIDRREAEKNIFFKCVGDELSGIPMNDIEALTAGRPSSLSEASSECYVKANEITEASIRRLRALNITSVYIGFESGVQRHLKGMRKGTSTASNLRAAELLGSAGIKIIGGAVVGFPGETTETLEETYQHFRQIQDASGGYLRLFNAQPLVILPGSDYWRQLVLRRPELFRPDYNSVEHQLAWIEEFCPGLGGTPEEGLALLVDYSRRIENLSPSTRKSGFGRTD